MTLLELLGLKRLHRWGTIKGKQFADLSPLAGMKLATHYIATGPKCPTCRR